MMDKYLVINYIVVEPELVLVGATDNQRWDWDTQDGYSGADAKTLVTVTLKGSLDSKYAIQEEAQFYCALGDPLRKLAMAYVYELFDIAWKIKKARLEETATQGQYIGVAVKSNKE